MHVCACVCMSTVRIQNVMRSWDVGYRSKALAGDLGAGVFGSWSVYGNAGQVFEDQCKGLLRPKNELAITTLAV